MVNIVYHDFGYFVIHKIKKGRDFFMSEKRKKKTYRREKGSGAVSFENGKRKKPWRARITITNSEGYKKLKTIGMFKTEREAKNALEEYINNPMLFEAKTITFAEVFSRWFSEKTTEASQPVLRKYELDFEKCLDLHNISFADVRPAHIQKIINDMAPTMGRHIKIMFSQMSDFAIRNNIIANDYSKYIKILKKKDKKEKTVFTDEEIQILWNNLGTGVTNSILIMIYTGMRIEEFLQLEKMYISFEERKIKIVDSKTEAGKRIIPISAKIEKLLKQMFFTSPFNTILVKNGRPYRYANYRLDFKETLNTLGIKEHSIHECRHTFITMLSDRNANTTAIKTIAGHTSYALSEKVYTHKRFESLLEAVDLL